MQLQQPNLHYALKNHFDEINPETYTIPDSEGNNYNVGSIDSDGQLAALIRSIPRNNDTVLLCTRPNGVWPLQNWGAN